VTVLATGVPALCGPHWSRTWFVCCVVQAVVFTRDSSSGRVRIDSEGRPVVTYWPCETTRKHLMEVRTQLNATDLLAWVQCLLPT
jgi:hypothetical protein